MKDGRHLDEYKSSYSPNFSYFEENCMDHAACGKRDARHVHINGALILGLEFTKVTKVILRAMATGPLNKLFWFLRVVAHDGPSQKPATVV